MSCFSQVPDPTQDEGFVLSPFDPSKRFLGTPTSTIETVRIDRSESRNSSPITQRKKKALRRGKAADLSMIVEQDEEAEEADEEQEDEDKGEFEVDASAFNIMKKAAKKPSTFDKNKSKARDVVEEAAEESDDEYAGLGGASDDDEDEENMFDRQMINDNSGETVDEKQLAALNAYVFLIKNSSCECANSSTGYTRETRTKSKLPNCLRISRPELSDAGRTMTMIWIWTTQTTNSWHVGGRSRESLPGCARLSSPTERSARLPRTPRKPHSSKLSKTATMTTMISTWTS